MGSVLIVDDNADVARVLGALATNVNCESVASAMRCRRWQ